MAFDCVTQVCLTILELERDYVIWPSNDQLVTEEANFFCTCGELLIGYLPTFPIRKLVLHSLMWLILTHRFEFNSHVHPIYDVQGLCCSAMGHYNLPLTVLIMTWKHWYWHHQHLWELEGCSTLNNSDIGTYITPGCYPQDAQFKLQVFLESLAVSMALRCSCSSQLKMQRFTSTARKTRPWMFSWLSTAGRKLFSTVLVRLGLTMTPVSTVGVNCSSCLPLFHDSTIFLVCYHLHTHSTLIASLSPWYSMSSTGDSDTLNTSLLKPYPDRSDNSGACEDIQQEAVKYSSCCRKR